MLYINYKKLWIILYVSIISCGSTATINNKQKHIPIEANAQTASIYANTIVPSNLKEHLYTIASDEFKGRATGKEGQKKAANYLKDFYSQNNIRHPKQMDDYFQIIPSKNLGSKYQDSENVLAFIEGTEIPEEIIIVSAHYDHLGTKDVDIYNGADDNGSGSTALMAIAKAFQKAKNDGNGAKRSILILHVTAEEIGLLGSKYYVEHPIFPLKNTVVNLNIDMIGRVDDIHENNSNYIYLIGSDKLSTELHQISEAVNSKFTSINLDYTYNSKDDPNQYYYRSDHYNFAKNNIPIIFYFNGTHQDYHKPSDTPDKINYNLLAKRTQLVFYTAWELANREQKVLVD
ncbi:M28 family metallopeptidase [Lutibacter sp. TH_r2]|uniref:M28 family metallopeptidase n=1 Tax=Lutibacter sp. TH_r2 TaxID=3082083 RepID=UPI0029550DB2|nr:M28 family metallopeptidase [Lutibacter sp. TH_r2]MDV7188107.1 M28 family metallopeptidase [Lutibacter sp. TH_r2]